MNDDKDEDIIMQMLELMFQLEQVKHNAKELNKAKRYIKTAAQANMAGLIFAIGCFIAFFADSIAGPMLVCWAVCVSFAELYINRVSRIMYEAHPAFVTNPPPGGKNWKALTAAVSTSWGMMGAMIGLLISGVFTGFAFAQIIGSTLIWGIMFGLQKYFRRRLDKLTVNLPRSK